MQLTVFEFSLRLNSCCTCSLDMHIANDRLISHFWPGYADYKPTARPELSSSDAKLLLLAYHCATQLFLDNIDIKIKILDQAC